jgi:hypothetical protein
MKEEKEKETKENQKEKKPIAKQYKYCEKLLEKSYCKYNNISDFEFCIGSKITYIK